jgi:hypothetical protein
MNMESMRNAVYFLDKISTPKGNNGDLFIPIDQWDPKDESEVIVNCVPGFFVAPISIIGNINIDKDSKFDYFMLSPKKCYNSVEVRKHLYRYLNYFCNFYDFDKEYLSILFILKIKMERYSTDQYPPDAFFNDIDRYILRSDIVKKVKAMVDDNYCQDLDYKNIKSPSLQYTNDHAKLLHMMSILMDMCIPLLTNYAYMHKIGAIDDFLLCFYDRILHIDPSIDMYVKLYDTAYTNAISNQRNNQGIWIKQDIRSIDATTHSTDSVHNIILNIVPKYTFDKNIVSFNYASIKKNTAYKITDISFEYSFVPISSSKRDNDSVSDFDRFESSLVRQNEALYLQNKINCREVMRTIESQFGPFDQEELDLYLNGILKDKDGNPVINPFQKQLVFSLFYKYFRDTQSIYAINKRQYAELIIAAKKILKSKNMLILPYIISGSVDKLVQKKCVNKKEKYMIETSPTYKLLLNKYRNENITNQILSIIGTIICSDFSIIDLDPAINGKPLNVINIEIIIEEVEMYILMC